MSELGPITAELREMMGGVEPRVDEDGVVTAKYVTPEAWGEFVSRCDAIDAVHAQLERENAELRERVAVLDESADSMHDGGSITDELRGWYKDRMFMGNGWQELDNIADRIDAEHQKAIRELNNLADASVLLPVDADGERIHIGDVMEWVSPYEDYKPAIRTVDGVGEQAFFAWTKEDGRYAQYEARAYRHHHAPTVEDVLTEFAAKLIERGELTNGGAQTIAEYAAKLRLAGDAS